MSTVLTILLDVGRFAGCQNEVLRAVGVPGPAPAG